MSYSNPMHHGDFDFEFDDSPDEYSPASVLDWLASEDIEHKALKPLGEDQIDATVGQLLTTIMGGREEDAIRAVYQLRERFLVHQIIAKQVDTYELAEA